MRKALYIATILASVAATHVAAQTPLVAMPAKAGINTSEFGTQVDVVNEDFSKFSTGTEEAPDFSVNINTELDSKVPYFENVSSQYTTLPRWGAAYAYPAGGCVCLYSNDVYENAHINTPMFDASKNDGVFIIRFRARLLQDVTDYSGIGLHILDFSNSEKSGSYQIMTTIKNVTSEWRTFELVVHNGTNRMLVNFSEETQSKLLLDDIQVLQVDQFVGTPHILHHLAYSGTSFRPHWNKVEGAESYLVNVYNSDKEGTIGEPVVENMQTTDTICTVRGLIPGNIYRYNVTAVAGEHHSIPSNNVELFDLATPSFNETVENNGTYETSWSNVPEALYYNYYIYEEKTAPEDGELVLFDENFDGVTDQGNESKTWGVDDIPDFGLQMQDIGYPKNLGMNGWTAYKWAPLSAGYIAVDAWNYFYDVNENVKDYDINFEDIKMYAKLETPELDLSKDDGKLHVKADLWGQLAEDDTDADNNYPAYQVNAVIALMNYDVNAGAYVEAESKHFDLSEKWTTCEVDFTKGSENSKVMIYATDGPGLLFIDNLKATQYYSKGETFSSPLLTWPGQLNTSVQFTLPENEYNYYQRVEAASQREMYWGTRTYTFYSRLADAYPVRVSSETAIKGTAADANGSVKARIENGDIVVSGVSGKVVNVYTVGGTLVARAVAHTDSVALPVKASGVYVVNVGNKSIKVAK